MSFTKHEIVQKKFSFFAEDLIAKSHSLESIGIFSLAWRIKDYDEVVVFLIHNNKIILGGDLLFLDTDNRFHFDGASWNYDLNRNISLNENLASSRQKALDFLDRCRNFNFGDKKEASLFVDFVFAK